MTTTDPDALSVNTIRGLCMDAIQKAAVWDELAAGGIGARVVSMPCWELFDRQPQAYRDEVLPPAVKARVAVEQASTLGWDRYVGDGGAVIGMHTFGASAPLKELLTKFGFTPERVSQVARERVAAAAAAAGTTRAEGKDSS